MSRAARTLLIVVGIGLVGLFALTWMARRYANLQPTASVSDVAPSPVPGTTPHPAPTPPPPDSPPADAPPPAATEPASAAGPREADLREVDRFVAVRRALRQVIAEEPKAAEQLAEQLAQGDAAQAKPLQFNLVFLMKFRLTREAAIRDAGWSIEAYRAFRDEVAAWRDGTPPADPERARAFEARREALEAAGLDRLEPLDALADSGAEG